MYKKTYQNDLQFTSIDEKLFESIANSKKLSASNKLVAVHLIMKYNRETKSVCRSVRTIAKELKMSKNTVQQSITILKSIGFIKQNKVKGKGKNGGDYQYFTFPKISLTNNSILTYKRGGAMSNTPYKEGVPIIGTPHNNETMETQHPTTLDNENMDTLNIHIGRVKNWHYYNSNKIKEDKSEIKSFHISSSSDKSSDEDMISNNKEELKQTTSLISPEGESESCYKDSSLDESKERGRLNEKGDTEKETLLSITADSSDELYHRIVSNVEKRILFSDESFKLLLIEWFDKYDQTIIHGPCWDITFNISGVPYISYNANISDDDLKMKYEQYMFCNNDSEISYDERNAV